MADSLTLKEVELDYEADEVDDIRGDDGTDGTPREEDANVSREEGEEQEEGEEGEEKEQTESKKEEGDSLNKQGDIKDGDADGPDKNGEEEIESGEELEDGELSDEDETAKNERLEPKPVCRFYSKGQCTWGASCRFMHPGVLDKGNYSMFAPPRPILPGEPEEPAGPVETEPVLIAPPVPAFESAWERGLRQAKEMRRRSAKRKEMDVEYEEKKSSMSLTQIELDKENDYYMRPASPAHTYDPYADDDPTTDPYDTYHPEVRRIAPPPPPEFLAKEDSAPRRYSHSPPPNVRRVAPPRSPSPGREVGGRPPRSRGQEDWADPWMRSREEKRMQGGRVMGRIRSYSSGSSRSSSSGSSRSRSPPPRTRHYSSSMSSHSSSRSRSSTPTGIPRRKPTPTQQTKDPGAPPKNTAPLQKRLAGAAPLKPNVPKTGVKPGSKPLLVPKLETDRDRKPNVKALERKNKGRSSSSESGGSKSPRRRQPHPRPQQQRPTSHRSTGREKEGGKDPSGRSKDAKGKDVAKLKDGASKPKEVASGKPKEPFKMNISVPKNQIKLTLKTSHTAKPANQTVLEKLGMTNEDLVEAQKGVKKPGEPTLKRKTTGQENTDSPKKKKLNVESAEKKKGVTVDPSNTSKLVKPVKVPEQPVDKDKLKAKVIEKEKEKEKAKKQKSASDAQGRREELLKQLKAVEDAITRKRTKLEK